MLAPGHRMGEDDVLYWIQADAGTKRQEKKRLRRMANSAIRHGAR